LKKEREKGVGEEKEKERNSCQHRKREKRIRVMRYFPPKNNINILST
jgi:hypothetical protein